MDSKKEQHASLTTDMATDYLTCGQCLREFPLQCITLFIQHKKLDCDDENDLQNENPELKCNYCPQGFMTAWALLVHAQLTHNLKIFLEKASKSFLNQVKLSPVGQGDTSKKSSNIKISLPVSDEKVSGTKDTQQRLKGNSETVVSQDRDKTDHLCPVLNDIQPLTGISTKPSKMGSDFIVTRNTLTGTKKVGEKMETTLGNISLEKSVTRNTVAHVSSASQITTSQKLSLLPINQVSASFLPKLSVLPLTVSSGQIKTSSIKVLPTVLTRTGSQPPPESTVNSVLTVLKKEHSPGISVPQNDNLGLDNQMLTQETSAVLVSSTAGVPSSSASKLTQQATKSTEILTCTNIIESTQQVTSVDSKSVDSTCRTAEITVKQLQSSASVSLPTDGDNNQGNDGTGVELDSQGPECCNQQGCGVTVIPGSHEDLQECCNAVLPKKRKRHMELKHMPFSWSSSRYARRKRSAQLMSKPSTGTIYIDLEPDSSNSGERPADGTAFKVTQSASQGVKILGTSNSSMVSSGDSVSQSKPHSLILKPGAVFSIPFTYTIPTSKSLQNTIALPVARETLSLAETAQQTGSSSSSACVMVDLPKLSNEEGNQSHTSAQCMLPNLDTVAEGQILQLEKSKKYSGIATKPFQCDKCTMAFNQRIHLKKHMSKHTGIKPYKCGECNYSTVERSHLKVHIRIHTGEKPFKCTYCEYATAQNSTLKIHLKRHHGGRMFQCQKCEKQFTQEQQLKGHVLEHGSPPSLAPDQKAPSNEKFGAQQTASALQLSSPNTQASKTTQNASQVSSTDRYSSQEEVLPSQSTNQQQEPVHVDTINSISQSG